MSVITQPKFAPTSPGIYIFKRGKTPIYVGKAANLKRRLASYFRKNTGWKTAPLLREATGLDWIEILSEIEALILESELIKKHRPKFNYQFRDDKNYFYVGITKEKFPKIFITHQPNAERRTPKTSIIGPFTNGSALKIALRFIRRIFPYCTCKKSHKRPCLNAEINRCLGICCIIDYHGKNSASDYRKNIRTVRSVLSGRGERIIAELKRKMRQTAELQEFEKAAELRDQIAGLKNIFEHSSNAPSLAWNKKTHQVKLGAWRKLERNLKMIIGNQKKITRVEGYDISNISGSDATGSMVVFIDGRPAKSEYRKFKIKTVKGLNDIEMLKETVKRRLNHSEWPYPELMLIDGGKPQLNGIRSVLRFLVSDFRFQVMALAKREEELYTESGKIPIRLDSLPPYMANFLKRVRDESHRFAKKYHHKLREISYREQTDKN